MTKTELSLGRSAVFTQSSRRWAGLFVAAAAAAILAFTGCNEPKKTEPATPAAPQKPAPKPEVTVLVTGDENGWLNPEPGGDGKVTGGAASLMGKWVKDEGACAPAAPCEDPGTLALSTGDHFNGQATSSFFFGEPTAEVMQRMGYAASGFGNHELDFGIDEFVKLRQAGGFPYLAANVKVAEGGPQNLGLKPFQVFERRGFKIGVVGLANVNAPKTVMAGRFSGLEVQPYEDALTATLPEVRKAGADAVVVLVDECPDQLEQTFSNHADWKVALVVGGHCRDAFDKTVGSKGAETRMYSPGRRFAKYVRAKLTFDAAKPAGERLKDVDAKVVDVGGADADVRIAAAVDNWKKKLDEALGEQIGFTKTGLKQDSPEMANWITTAWRETFETDVAIVNKGGIRQDLAPGRITRASVYSVLPFENSVMVVKLPGDALQKALDNENARFSGMVKAGKGYKDAKGKALDPKKSYSVATVEFLYFGGDGFDLEQHDPLPTETGQVWQTPVVSWTKKQATDEKKPLESVLKK